MGSGIAQACAQAGYRVTIMDIDDNIVTKTTETILGTNTSSIAITEIAAAVRSPERVVGIHFFNPIHRMQLVEIVKGLLATEETVALAKDFVLSLRKEPGMVNRDSAGFVVGRINGMALLEALRPLETGTASVEESTKPCG